MFLNTLTLLKQRILNFPFAENIFLIFNVQLKDLKILQIKLSLDTKSKDESINPLH